MMPVDGKVGGLVGRKGLLIAAIAGRAVTRTGRYKRLLVIGTGTAALGSLFTSNLVRLLRERLPADAQAGEADFNAITPEVVAGLPGPLHDIVVSSYNDALAPVLGWIAPLVLVAMVLLMFVREVPLRTTVKRR